MDFDLRRKKMNLVSRFPCIRLFGNEIIVHEVFNACPILGNIYSCYPSGILYWLVLPFDQTLKVFFITGSFGYPLIQHNFNFFLKYLWELFLLSIGLIYIIYRLIYSNTFYLLERIQIYNIENWRIPNFT